MEVGAESALGVDAEMRKPWEGVIPEVGGCGEVGSTAAILIQDIRDTVLDGKDFGVVDLFIDGPATLEDDTWTIRFVREDGAEVSRKVHGSDLTFAHPDVQQALREIREELEEKSNA